MKTTEQSPQPKDSPIRLDVVRYGHFPDLDGDTEELDDPDEIVARVSVLPNQQQARWHMKSMPAASRTSSRVPSRVFNEVLSGNYEPSIAARLVSKYRTGTPDFNEAYVMQRVAQIEQAARPNPAFCAMSAEPPPPAGNVHAGMPGEVLEHNPWVLNRPGDVPGIFGLGFVIWIAFEILSIGALAWGLAWFLPHFKEGIWGGCVGLAIVVNWGLWHSFQGQLYTRILRPAWLAMSLMGLSGIAAAACRALAGGMISWGSSAPPAVF
jgi:hypothetical protein